MVSDNFSVNGASLAVPPVDADPEIWMSWTPRRWHSARRYPTLSSAPAGGGHRPVAVLPLGADVVDLGLRW